MEGMLHFRLTEALLVTHNKINMSKLAINRPEEEKSRSRFFKAIASGGD